MAEPTTEQLREWLWIAEENLRGMPVKQRFHEVASTGFPAVCRALLESRLKLEHDWSPTKELKATLDDVVGLRRENDRIREQLAAVEWQRDGLNAAIRLCIGRKTGIPWREVPQREVDGYVNAVAELAAEPKEKGAKP